MRDKLAVTLRGAGLPVRRAARDELAELLRAKVVEEALELADRPGPEEAGDLLEAVRALLGLYGYTLEDALREMRRKRAERGGFEEGHVLCLPPGPSPEGEQGQRG